MTARGLPTGATLAAILRPGADATADVRRDLAWLLALALIVIGAGLGWRDPWPADEPRFALIARDMVATGNWLIPMVGGDLYPDKPPLYFWLIAACYVVTGSLRVAFLLPSLLAAIGTLLLVYDLGRRVWNRTVGCAAALALLFTLQFFWQGRQAQIDGVLCFWTTLSLYGLSRHLFQGPAWGWYVVGWAAAGFGVITKGVGFLPLLVLLPYALLRDPRWHPRPALQPARRWWLGPIAFIAAVGVWLAPMLIASLGDPALAAYRDEILFQQTVERYAGAWHHREPFWYFLINVIPGLWLPLTALLPWSVPRWHAAIADRDLRIAALLAWVGLVVLFFSVSAGKRGVYVLPALPAFALATGAALVDVAARRGPARMIFAAAGTLVAIAGGAALYVLLRHDARADVIAGYGLDPLAPLVTIAVAGLASLALLRPSRGFAACGAVIAVTMVVTGFWINPGINASRSGASFVREVESQVAAPLELGLVAYKEQYLLEFARPTVNFGHRRWREGDREAADAAAWLEAAPGRILLIDKAALAACFDPGAARTVAEANGTTWYLVDRGASAVCVAKGDPAAARRYDPRHPPGGKVATIAPGPT
jgi:4-amino-4-deoxy-L-arabinose transferase-like glycosyltransferase